MKLSFAICTYNRLSFLELVIADFLAELDRVYSSLKCEDKQNSESRIKAGYAQKSTIELILIDNNSTDGTKEFYLSLIEKIRSSRRFPENSELKISFEYIFKKEQGLSHARNAAIDYIKNGNRDDNSKESHYLIFLDDDIRLSESFLLKLQQRLFSIKEKEFIASVKIIPDWLKPVSYISFKPPLALSPSVFPSHDFGEEIREYPFIHEGLKVSNPIGAVMIVELSVFQRLGNFNIELGVGSSNKGFGLHEDTEFFRKAISAGIKIFYWGDISVTHPVTAERVSPKYINSWYFKSGKSLTYLALKEPELFPSQQAEMIGFPASLVSKIPKFLIRLLKIKFLSIPLYLLLKSLGLFALLISSKLSFNRRLKVWLNAMFMKSLGEISALLSLSAKMTTNEDLPADHLFTDNR